MGLRKKFKKKVCDILLKQDVFTSKKISSNPNIIFSITTHKNTNYDDYILVLDQLKQANASKISIANPPSF